ncbi:MAG TPA: preprotein translocase subunit SecG [Candidatus Sulfotelmatobacter sp.]|jgi:protein translocase SecG subunit|nr:preprotein translocase subunit SecG [Candidatus Sulfotelmatobacter sp.]
MVITILQIVISTLLIAAVLLQAPGTGLSPVFGAGGEAYRSKRSAQKFLIITTIALSSILAILSLIHLFLQK